MTDNPSSQQGCYKYLSRYVPKDLKFILGIINMGGGTLDIGGLNGDSGFRQVHKLQELILKQAKDKNIEHLICFTKLAIENNLFRISIRIIQSDELILSKEQAPLFLGSQVLFKSPTITNEFKKWESQYKGFKQDSDLWEEFQSYQLNNSIQFNQSERKLILQKSEDGSHTLFIPEMNETYHSTKGSRTEAEYVFLKQGIDFTLGAQQKGKLSVLEVGFGTGLNAWLSFKKASEENLDLNYCTLEPFPIPLETLEHLEFGFDSKADRKIWLDLHSLAWEATKQINSNFEFQKFQKKLEDFKSKVCFDLIFFDAFAPSKQPELWSLEVFQKCFELLEPKGCLVSYCASSIFKKNLLLAGFEIENLEGPPGKREMVRAIKS